MEKLKIFDVHAHIYPDKIAGKAVEAIGQFYSIAMAGDGTVSDLLLRGSKAGVCRYVVHSTATRPDQVKAINDFIANVQAGYDNLIGFGTIHPDFNNIDKEIDRMIALGLRGIKLHPDFQEFDIDAAGMMPVYEALEGRLPILVHMGDRTRTYSRPDRLARVLDRFPRLTVIAAHFGGYSAWDLSLEYLVGRDVYFDTSSSLWKLEHTKVLDIIKQHGADKILFGSDYPMWDYSEELDRFDALGLSDTEREMILWRNACRLLLNDNNRCLKRS